MKGNIMDQLITTQETERENIAKTLARELKVPIEIASEQHIKRIALPPGWEIKECDDVRLLPAPSRKISVVRLADAEGFVAYIKRHGSLTHCTIWCELNPTAGNVLFTGIINDHGEDEHATAWRDHLAFLNPEKAEEWNRWTGKNKQTFTQADFAAFIEDNLRDIAGVEGQPSGAQMLEMALAFEANQDVRFKSAMRLQNGGVQMSFVQDDDAQTLQRMQVFDRFSIGIPVFWNGDPYRIDARLRYRVRDGKLAFWYELMRFDKVFEAATAAIVTVIREKTGNPFFFGSPF
jgi:uncharacterized protein YfdQ (DUF2303 family)